MDKTYSGSKQTYSGSTNNKYSMKRIGQKEEGNKEGRKEGRRKEYHKISLCLLIRNIFFDPSLFF